MLKIISIFFVNVFCSVFIALNAQDCPNTVAFTPSTTNNTINWKQFPPFSLPFTIIYGGPRFGDSESLPLKYGFSHLNSFSGSEAATLPLKNRAVLWYNVGTLAGQPWNEIASPWGNDLKKYQQKWKTDLEAYANYFNDSRGQSYPKTDILCPDIERQLETDIAIRGLKNNALVPDSYKKLDDVTFTERYKRDLQKLYTEPFNYLKTIGFPSSTKIGNYGDAPILSTNSVLNYDWTEWQNSISVLNPMFKDSLKNQVGGSFEAGVTTIFPSAYHCIESKDDGRNLATLLFQIEANSAWTKKDLILFEWVRYNRCQPTTNYNFRTFIKPTLAEAQAIFPFFSGAKGIWLWEDPAAFTGENYSLYEYFIKGLYRLSAFKDFFTGTYQLIIPKSAHAHFIDQDPIWRGVFKDNKMLVVAQNPYAKDGQTTTLKLTYNNFSKTISLTGSEVFLCTFEVNLATATDPINPILIYPNPTNGLVTLQNIAPEANLSVIDMLGRTITVEQIIQDANRIVKFSESGTYFIKITTKEVSQTIKVNVF